MKLSYRKWYKWSLFILTSIAIMLGSTQGAVHCQAENGHVAIEFAGSGCWNNRNVSVLSGESTPFPSEGFASSEDDCGPCVDTPVSIHLLRVSRSHNPVTPAPQACPMMTSATIFGCDTSLYQSSSELFAALSPTLTSLRSVIILV